MVIGCHWHDWHMTGMTPTLPSPRDRFEFARRKDDSSLPQLPGWLRPDVAMCSTDLHRSPQYFPNFGANDVLFNLFNLFSYSVSQIRCEMNSSETCPRHTVTHTSCFWPCFSISLALPLVRNCSSMNFPKRLELSFLADEPWL